MNERPDWFFLLFGTIPTAQVFVAAAVSGAIAGALISESGTWRSASIKVVLGAAFSLFVGPWIAEQLNGVTASGMIALMFVGGVLGHVVLPLLLEWAHSSANWARLLRGKISIKEED